jgi:hypothetical protein
MAETGSCLYVLGVRGRNEASLEAHTKLTSCQSNYFSLNWPGRLPSPPLHKPPSSLAVRTEYSLFYS